MTTALARDHGIKVNRKRDLPQVMKIMRDPCIAQGPDGTFHMVWTNSWESQTIGYALSKDLITWNKEPSPMKNLRLAVADRISGPYRLQADPINPPGSWVEGPSALQVGDTTYLYFDAYAKGSYAALRSRDMKTWEDVTAQLDLPKGTRHGTAFPVKAGILKRLLDNDNKPAC